MKGLTVSIIWIAVCYAAVAVSSNVFFFSNAQIQQHANLFVIWFQQGIQWTLKLRID
jgi:hypothetical protein